MLVLRLSLNFRGSSKLSDERIFAGPMQTYFFLPAPVGARFTSTMLAIETAWRFMGIEAMVIKSSLDCYIAMPKNAKRLGKAVFKKLETPFVNLP